MLCGGHRPSAPARILLGDRAVPMRRPEAPLPPRPEPRRHEPYHNQRKRRNHEWSNNCCSSHRRTRHPRGRNAMYRRLVRREAARNAGGKRNALKPRVRVRPPHPRAAPPIRRLGERGGSSLRRILPEVPPRDCRLRVWCCLPDARRPVRPVRGY